MIGMSVMKALIGVFLLLGPAVFVYGMARVGVFWWRTR